MIQVLKKKKPAASAKMATVSPIIAKRAQQPVAAPPPEPKRERETYAGRIHWTTEERTWVLARLAVLLLESNLTIVPEQGDRDGGQILMSCFRKAQVETLPDNRRRLINMNRAFIGKRGFADLEHKLKQLWANKQKAEEQALAGTVTPPPEAPAAPEKLFKDATAGELLGGGMAKFFADMSALEGLLMESNQTIAKQLTALQGQVETLTQRVAAVECLDSFGRGIGADDSRKHKESAEILDNQKLPRVAVIGCQVRQFRVIEEQLEKLHVRCQLQHYEQDSSSLRINGDYAICFRWANSEQKVHAKIAIPDASHVHLVSGVGNAIQQIQQWCKAA